MTALSTMSNSPDPKNDPKHDANLTGYERTCRAFKAIPNPEGIAIARMFEEHEKNSIKDIARKMKNRTSAATYEKVCRSFGYAPHPIAMKAAKELDEEDAAKAKSK